MQIFGSKDVNQLQTGPDLINLTGNDFSKILKISKNYKLTDP